MYNQANWMLGLYVHVAQLTLFYIQEYSRSILSILRPWIGWGEPCYSNADDILVLYTLSRTCNIWSKFTTSSYTRWISNLFLFSFPLLLLPPLLFPQSIYTVYYSVLTLYDHETLYHIPTSYRECRILTKNAGGGDNVSYCCCWSCCCNVTGIHRLSQG